MTCPSKSSLGWEAAAASISIKKSDTAMPTNTTGRFHETIGGKKLNEKPATSGRQENGCSSSWS